MKKTYLRTAISCLVFAILGMAVTFTSCNKDADLLDDGKIKGITAIGSVIKSGDFNENGEYYVSDGWFRQLYGVVGVINYTQGGPHNSTVNEVLNIFASANADAQTNPFTAFCANGWSVGFGNSYAYVVLKNGIHPEYSVLEPKLEKVTQAFNWIYNKYGSIDSWNSSNWQYEGWQDNMSVVNNTRILSQIAVWKIMLDIPDDILVNYFKTGDGAAITNNDFHAWELRPMWKEAADEMLANYQGATGPISKSYMLVGKDYPADVIHYQPQVVPVYETPND